MLWPPNPWGVECGSGSGHLRFFATPSDSFSDSVALLLQWTGLWILVWYSCACIAWIFLMHRLPPSSKAHENRAVYVGQKLAGTLKVLAVAALANAGLAEGWRLPPAEQFGGSLLGELAGVIFTSFELCDLLLAGAHRFLDAEHVFHHVVHIVLGLVIRGNCGPTFTACVLLAQETSGIFQGHTHGALPHRAPCTRCTADPVHHVRGTGIFLNYFLLMRHRAPDHPSVPLSFACFALAFFFYRLLLGTYATLHYAMHYRDVLLGPTPATTTARAYAEAPWQAHLVLLALMAGTCLQWWWGVVIARGAARKLKGSKAKGE